VTDPSLPLTPDDVRAAAGRISRYVWHTPLIPSAWLSDRTGAEVRLKLEGVQSTGSFKIRGALNAVLRLREQRPEASTVVTASAGNHGRAVALAARIAGIAARVYLPTTAPAAKRIAIGRLGATTIDTATYDEAEIKARNDSQTTGAVYISPYNHRDVMAGAGTVLLEVLADWPEVDTVVVPLGGGGLLSGTAVAARAGTRLLDTIGVEAIASPAFTSALAAGQIVKIHVQSTLADGLAGNMERGSLTFDLVRALGCRVVAVTEQAIEDAMRDLVLTERLVVEGAAATGVGALVSGTLPLTGRRVCVVLTGRNVDAAVIRRVLRGTQSSI
jgi:threonine dehydratase